MDTRRTGKQEPIGKDRTLIIPGCDSAIAGKFRRFGQPLVVVYDYEKLLNCFQKQGMTEEQASELICERYESKWLGTGMPAIMHAENEDAE